MAEKAIYKKYTVKQEEYITSYQESGWTFRQNYVTNTQGRPYPYQASYQFDPQTGAFSLEGDAVTINVESGGATTGYVTPGRLFNSCPIEKHVWQGPGSYIGPGDGGGAYYRYQFAVYTNQAIPVVLQRAVRGDYVEDVVLDKGSVVSGEAAEDGWWYELYKDMLLPAPGSITYAMPLGGKPLTLECGAVSEPYSETVSYVWERSIDGGVFSQIGVTTAPMVTDSIPMSGESYAARVKAVNNYGVESEYQTGELLPIDSNNPPVISGQDQDFGVIGYPVYIGCTITDPDEGDTLQLTETVTNGESVMEVRSQEIASGAAITNGLYSSANITKWLALQPGEHAQRLIVTDSNGGQAVRTWTFDRKVDRIAVSRVVHLDSMPSKVFLSIFPSPQELPADCTLTCEVCNNPYGGMTWEDCTDSLNKSVHTFTNTTNGSTSGFAYRIQIKKGTSKIMLDQVTVRLA